MSILIMSLPLLLVIFSIIFICILNLRKPIENKKSNKELFKTIVFSIFFSWALFTPCYMLIGILSIIPIYILATITGAINSSGAGALPFIGIYIGIFLAPVMAFVIAYKIVYKIMDKVK